MSLRVVVMMMMVVVMPLALFVFRLFMLPSRGANVDSESSRSMTIYCGLVTISPRLSGQP